jgi:hypothetical protein
VNEWEKINFVIVLRGGGGGVQCNLSYIFSTYCMTAYHRRLLSHLYSNPRRLSLITFAAYLLEVFYLKSN